MKTLPRLSPETAKQHYRVQLMAGMSLYVVAILTCAHYLKSTPPGPLKVTLAVLPTLPVIWIMWSLAVYLKRADELERRVHTEALSIAAGAVALFTLVYGFMEEFAAFPHVAAWWYFVALDMVWGASCCVLWHRYQ